MFQHQYCKLHLLLQLQVRRGSSTVSQSNYRILGWLSLVQIMFTFLRHVFHNLKSARKHAADSSFIASLLAPGPLTNRWEKVENISIQLFILVNYHEFRSNCLSAIFFLASYFETCSLIAPHNVSFYIFSITQRRIPIVPCFIIRSCSNSCAI